MFDASFLEMLLVGVVALVVVGPERLPSLAAKAGRMLAKVRRFIATTRSDIERELQAEELRSLLSKQEEEIRELRDIMQQNTDSLRNELRDTESMIDSVAREAANTIKPLSKQTAMSTTSANKDEKLSS
ncbi:MAG: twin-arginine translocase subunit TatB [Proteobacteria bacterium]|nr:MAG: twin-arginine translocase subunit TatB [Pseudomonadota bacterium]